MQTSTAGARPAHIVLFDGVCNLCSASVQWILSHDPEGRFHFASLQSNRGKEILKSHGLPEQGYKSFVLVHRGRVYTRSTAALAVVKQLKGPVSWFYLFIVVPPFIRDAFYDFIARNRYQWFGRQNECWVPRPEWKSRFLI